MICCISHNSDPYTIYYNCGIEDHKTMIILIYSLFVTINIYDYSVNDIGTWRNSSVAKYITIEL